MNRRIVAAAIGVITAAATVGTAVALPSHSSTRTFAFPFTAVQAAQRNFHNGNFVGADADMQSGHTIGTDTVLCVPQSGNKTANCEFAASFRKGQLSGNFVLNFKDGSVAGKITDGTREFKNAVGTIKGTAISDTKTKVSVRFQTP